MPDAPNRILARDLTQQRVGQGMMNAAIILDACSCMLVGIRLLITPDDEWCLNTLVEASAMLPSGLPQRQAGAATDEMQKISP